MGMRRFIIVGASGVIGSALLHAARSATATVIGTALSRTRRDLVTFDMGTTPLRSIVSDLGRNDVVYLLAGYISPGWVYLNPEAARHLNVDCSKRLVEEVEAAGARLVFMSTDQVFDGETGGYVETSATHPLNLYGGLKAEMESHVLSASNGIVARTGWNVGWHQGQHCAVSQCYETLLKPNARMAFDNFFNVTDVNDTARGLLALAAERLSPRRIYHLVSAPEISRADLARIIKATSLWGSAMSYATVPFASISYSEPRPTRAFLHSLSVADLGLQFAPSTGVICRKVAVLDRWRMQAGAAPPQSASALPGRNEGFPRNPVSDTIR